MQNYKNHRQIVYKYYLMAGVPILILIFLSIKKLMNGSIRKIINSYTERETAVLFLIVAWILLVMLFKSRSFALTAQDRAIRAEENLRHFVLTGKRLDSRLTIRQIVALRFASDEELPSLAQRAVGENLTNGAIKKAIKNWRADTYRV
jgi:hypothetical protein